MLLIIKKDEIEHAATRVLTQIQVDQEAGVKAFDEYVNIRYPYLESAKKRERERTLELLYKEIKKGALSLTPMGQQVRSRMRSQIQRVSEEDAPERIKSIMKKVGRNIPL